MLRITVHDDSQSPTVQLEGTLMGPWVPEAASCLQQTQSRLSARNVKVDLTGVTTIDAAGKSFLASAHSRGATLVASGCLMRAIVGELVTAARRESGSMNDNNDEKER
jgi:ABC-type transporter Mla MlaB component